MDETVDLLDVLLDGVTEPRLKLISKDEARALMVLLGLLEDTEPPEDVRRAVVEMRVRIGSRLG
ncbi:hypothetical protein [Streptomyces sp. NBC_01264]|uniref:hypothetical protein n=1 Tax=Streptomyces sp. NBC_01264 TaxID=2903804 RepID=UPI00225171EA|nr:hypothetical protein [Streptomyces sp. NBC_01264]MCX4775577.1 hypothetical protein [Streptomyces sp. NBC_01264]